MSEVEPWDIIVVGAGLSGVGGARVIQDLLPEKRFLILEGRERIGGTWDLFRYPGIRSDSDMYTYAFSFKPWASHEAVAGGSAILAYIEALVREGGLKPKIRLGHRVRRVSWSSDRLLWRVEVERTSGESSFLETRFLYMGTGYYRYEKGYMPDFPGKERFRGPIIHPQHWDASLDVKNRHVVVIGSGATAIGLVPALAKAGAQVTMLQRSPTYVISLPTTDGLALKLRRFLKEEQVWKLMRLKYLGLGMAFYEWTRLMPKAARRFLVEGVREEIGEVVDVDIHFWPRYNPWDQRLCLITDGDLFEALRKGKAKVVTGEIASFTESGVLLRDGRHLEADIIVSATGLDLLFLGGIEIEIDGQKIDLPSRLLYRGMMIEGVPNLVCAFGYVNASWTLRAELVARWTCRLLKEMEKRKSDVVFPSSHTPDVEPRPLVELTSGYILRALDRFPKQGSRLPWRAYQNYFVDRLLERFWPWDDGVLCFKQSLAENERACPQREPAQLKNSMKFASV
ncbi:MAG: NAD(P)/FAD-dependent oxidoreductase [Sandaracinaceae bacterium]|nr:NAD(P)/FAD-dependent oxidoreductase [Sandaracinaceae bacterium]